MTITDNIAPVVNCKDITVELDAQGNGSYSANMLDAGVTDNCGLGQNGYPEFQVTCANIGTFPVTYVVRDAAGNEGSCTGNVTITGSNSNRLSPVLEGITFNPDLGQYEACFGYLSENSCNVSVPVGAQNKFTPGTDLGQSTEFMPGRQVSVFCIPMETGQTYVWTLTGPDGKTRTATAGFPNNDADGDGVIDEEDNCPDTYNPNQADADGDGFGDVCQPTNDGEMVVQFIDSKGNPIEGGVVTYNSGGWKSFGTTDANGEAKLDLDPGTYSFRMTYAGYTEQKSNVNITQTNPLVYQTVNMNVEFTDSQGNPYDEGIVTYNASGWKSFGTIANGSASRELLPGTYSFRLKYAGYTQQKSNVNIANINPLVYQTQNMVVEFIDSQGNAYDEGVVTYNASGWKSFGTIANGSASRELLPGTYSFRLKYAGYTQQKSNINIANINPLVYQTQNMVVEFIDSQGNAYDEGVVTYNASGWKSFGTIANGSASMELLAGTYSFRLKYAGYTQQKSNINIAQTNPLVYQTVNMTVNFFKSDDFPHETGEVTYNASGWKSFGTIANGSASMELLAGTYSFRLRYAGYTQQKSNINITQTNPLEFVTIPMVVRLEDNNQNGLSGGVATYNASGWKDFGTTEADGNTPALELLAGTYSFRMNYEGQTDQLSNVDITIENPVVFINTTPASSLAISTPTVSNTSQSGNLVTLKAFPNPASDEVWLQTQNIDGVVRIEIFNSLGELLSEKAYNVFESERLKLNIDTFAPGLLLVKVNYNSGNQTISLIKK